MKPWWAIAFGIVCGLLAAGVLSLVASQPRGQPVQLSPPPTASPCLVHVSGAVANPGVYPLSRLARVRDALLAAGGALPKADLDAVNLAAFVEDGARIWVPWKAEAGASPVAGHDGQPAPAFTTQPPPASLPGPIDLNSASQSQLESLPGIGPVIAGRIVAYRQANGPFLNVEDLLGVTGIGPSILEKIEGLVTVGGMPAGPD